MPSFSLPSPPTRGLFDTVVTAHAVLCREHWRLTLRAPAFPPTQPGQFLQVECHPSVADHDGNEVGDPDGLGDDAGVADWPPFGRPGFGDAGGPVLRRPFSLAGRRDTPDGTELDVILRTVGVGTRYLAGLAVGDRVSVLGPLGRGFTPPPAGGLALLVGGGVGIPPMLYMAERLGHAAAATPDGVRPPRAVAFCGALTRDLLPLTITADALPPAADAVGPLYNVAEFADHGVPAVLSTDDGTYGYRGYVTDALSAYLDAWITDNADRARTVIYACGPEPMLKATAAVARRRGIACQVCVERAMACGLGTCQSCCIRVKKPDPAAPPMAGSDWCYRLACTEGPVFDAETLLW